MGRGVPRGWIAEVGRGRPDSKYERERGGQGCSKRWIGYTDGVYPLYRIIITSNQTALYIKITFNQIYIF